MYRYPIAGLCLYALLSHAMAATDMTDPTRPTNGITHNPARADGRTPWVLTATLVSPQRSLATINGRLLARGEQIDKATVVAIDASSVLLREGTREFRVMLSKPSIRTTTSRRPGSPTQ